MPRILKRVTNSDNLQEIKEFLIFEVSVNQSDEKDN
jgi:hypothetical protein